MLPETITMEQGAERWGVSISTLRRAIKRGDVLAYRPGKRVLIDVASGDAWWKSTGNRVVGADERAKKEAQESKPVRRRRIW